jgi:hypothetical protein
MPDNTSPPAKSNPVVSTLLVTAALAGAMLAGASINGANGPVKELFRSAGFGRTTEIVAEQRRQAQALEKIELAVIRTRADVAVLNARVDEAENLYQEAVNAAPGSPASGNPEPDSKASGDLPKNNDTKNGDTKNGGQELEFGVLRASLDEQAEHNRNEFHAVNKRLDWLEKFIYGPEGAVQPARMAPRRPSRLFARRWRVLHAGNGAAVISSKDGAIDVTPGTRIPELGRVSAIRQERGRWVVVTDNGMTIRER